MRNTPKFRAVFLSALILPPALLAQTAAPPPSQPVPQPTTATQLPPITTTVNVTGTITSETPAAITVLNQDAVRAIPGIEMDDRLRQVPGFSLFRRSSSMVANPTTQGVSLRGIGSNGASRTLVLWDSIPINDPFGGWVYWDRIDPFYVDRVEVEQGAPTAVFGDRAMSGTVAMFSQPEQHQHAWADVIGGNDATVDASAGYADLWGPWGLSVNSRGFTTDGYYITPPSVRGTADTRANVRFATGDLNLDYLGSSNRLSIHGDVLAEERANGTHLTHNSTGLGTIGANYTHSWTNDEISIVGFHTQGDFHSTYSSVSLNRNFEKLTARQRVPEEDVGGAAYWQHHGLASGRHWNLTAGTDADGVHGISYDYSVATGKTTPNGGTLLEHGEFAQGDVLLGPARLFAGIRQEFTGEHGQTFVSPNAGAAVGLGSVRLRASAYRSFRAPTLNELYRPFRVGNAQTFANADLVPESLTGLEAGLDWRREDTTFSLTFFHDGLNNLIDNATLSSSPTLIIRKRENFPHALSRGAQASVAQKWGHMRAQAGYLYVDGTLSTGQRIPQVPRQQGTAELVYMTDKTLLSAGVRAFGLQFDDDLNQFLLPGFAVLQIAAQRKLTNSLAAIASVENLLDRSYLVALTPNPNTGEPRLWQVGLRWSGTIH